MRGGERGADEELGQETTGKGMLGQDRKDEVESRFELHEDRLDRQEQEKEEESFRGKLLLFWGKIMSRIC